MTDTDGWFGKLKDRDRGRASGDLLAQVEAEARQDKIDRADPNTARLVESRDHEAAGGRFDLSDSAHRLVILCRSGRQVPRNCEPPRRTRVEDSADER